MTMNFRRLVRACRLEHERQKMKDTPTPLTDQLIEEMRHGYGIPKCAEWDRMVEHAREMERRAHAYKVVAVAHLKA